MIQCSQQENEQNHQPSQENGDLVTYELETRNVKSTLIQQNPY